MPNGRERENTREYLERALGNSKFTVRGRSYSSNGVIKKTTIIGKGTAYKLGEQVNRIMAGKNGFKCDVGTLSSYQISSDTGQYDSATMVFEELLNKNKWGFSVYSNMKAGTSSFPLAYNTFSAADATEYEAKASYKYYWDHGIYVKKGVTITFLRGNYDAWVALGFVAATATVPARYDDKYESLRASYSADVDNKNLIIVPNGKQPGDDYTVLKITDAGDPYNGLELYPKLAQTKSYYHPEPVVTQTIYTQDLNTRNGIVNEVGNGVLYAPRQTDRRYYETYGIEPTGDYEYNDLWLCTIVGVESQAAVHKITAQFKYKKDAWSSDVYRKVKFDWDLFSDSEDSVGFPKQPPWNS